MILFWSPVSDEILNCIGAAPSTLTQNELHMPLVWGGPYSSEKMQWYILQPQPELDNDYCLIKF